MIAFVQLPYKRCEEQRGRGVRSLLAGFTVGILLAGQLGLLAWALIR